MFLFNYHNSLIAVSERKTFSHETYTDTKGSSFCEISVVAAIKAVKKFLGMCRLCFFFAVVFVISSINHCYD